MRSVLRGELGQTEMIGAKVELIESSRGVFRYGASWADLEFD